MTSVPGGARARLASAERLLGTFVQSVDTGSCELLGRLGCDLLCIEGEHSAMGVETIQRLVATVQRTAADAFVRVAGNDPIAIAAALDAGAQGIIVPRVERGSEAEQAVADTRFPPQVRRGLGPSRATGYGAEMIDYAQRANDELLLGIQVETRESVERLDELLAVAGVDLIFVGPADLACLLRITAPASAELRATVTSVLERAPSRGAIDRHLRRQSGGRSPLARAGHRPGDPGSDLMWLAHGVGAALAELARTADRPPS